MMPYRLTKGSALITVLMLTGVMAIMTAFLLKYSISERRANERQRLILRSRNMAENAALYASEQITNKLYKLRSTSKMAFLGSNAITLPPNNVLTTAYSSASDTEVYAGILDPGSLVYLDPADPVNATNPNAGLQVSTSAVPIVAKSTMTNSAVGTVTTYAEQMLEVAMMPLFQFAIFYNMDLEFGPGPNMTISGPVHTNGDFISRIQSGFTNTIRFTDRVTSAKGFYANTAHRGSTYMANGTVDNGPGGSGPLYFRKPSEAVTAGTNIKSGSGVWRDHKWGGSSETATTISQFRSFATSTYAGNLRTSAHGVTPLELPAIGTYDESTEEGRKNGRQMIAAPLDTDAGGLLGTKFGRNAGLYIIVNPDDEERTGRLPNGTTVAMRARSYRAFLHAANATPATIHEVVLPGQPSYGALNATPNLLPNRYRVDTAVGSNQVLRIPKGYGSELPDTGYAWNDAPPDFDSSPIPAEVLTQDAYFYDLRRAFNSRGYPFDRSSTYRFRPRPIAKIDFDLTRFKLAVERTLFDSVASTIFHPGTPDNANWSSNVLNPSASTSSYYLGLSPAGVTDFSTFPSYETIPGIVASQAAAYTPDSLVFRAWTQTGTGTVDFYAARFTVEDTTSESVASDASPPPTWTPRYASTSNETSVSYTPATGTTFVRVRLYRDGHTGTDDNYRCDEQIIPIVSDVAPFGVAASDADSSGAPDPSRFIVAETTATSPSSSSTWTDRYTSGVDETFVRFRPTAANVTGLRIRQYAAGGTATLVREQIVPVAIAALANDTHVIPSSSLTGGFLFDRAVAEMKVYVGGVDDTANWTFTATVLEGSVTGSFGSPPFHHRYSVSGISNNAGVAKGRVQLTASKTGFTSLSKEFTLYKQSGVSGLGSGQVGRWLSVNNSVAPDPFRLYYAATGGAVPASGVISGSTSPWFDGITIYLHSVDAENTTLDDGNTPAKPTDFIANARTRARVDSGVRLWNGRGPLVTLPSATYPGRTGLSFVTNDAVYIMGHFNADGSINSTLSSTGTGGYSGRYPESSSEMLVSVMGDAINIFSQPEFARSGSSPNYRYFHSSGWSDSLSASRRDDSANYSSSWMSANPANDNTLDGLNASIQPALMPNLTVASSVTGAGPKPGATLPDTRSAKFTPAETEVSACLLTGIVPTTRSTAAGAKQTSGGVHNFPRLSENWAGNVALYIRGSMVAMFESQVATEPWSIRYYQGAIRNWGLHESLRDANHDVPLEPIVLNARRMSYREVDKDTYDNAKADILELPH